MANSTHGPGAVTYMGWDIEAKQNYKEELRFRPARVKDGTGRYHTKAQAVAAAAYANGGNGRSAVGAFGQAAKHAEAHRGRKYWPTGWWQEAAQTYKKRHAKTSHNRGKHETS